MPAPLTEHFPGFFPPLWHSSSASLCTSSSTFSPLFGCSPQSFVLTSSHSILSPQATSSIPLALATIHSDAGNSHVTVSIPVLSVAFQSSPLTLHETSLYGYCMGISNTVQLKLISASSQTCLSSNVPMSQQTAPSPHSCLSWKCNFLFFLSLCA